MSKGVLTRDGQRLEYSAPRVELPVMRKVCSKDDVGNQCGSFVRETYQREQIRGKDGTFDFYVHYAPGDERCLVEMLLDGYRRG